MRAGWGLRIAAGALFAAAVMAAADASANAFYHFTSGDYFDVTDAPGVPGGFATDMSIRGELELSGEIPDGSIDLPIVPWVVRFSFDDGRTTYTEANAGIAGWSFVTTSAAGAIVMFSLTITTNDGLHDLFLTRLPVACQTCNTSRARHFLTPGSLEVDTGRAHSGVWTTPEPSTAVLMGLGLAVVSARRRRRAP